MRVSEVIDTYRAIFKRAELKKREIDMAHTGSNRGWRGFRAGEFPGFEARNWGGGDSSFCSRF